MKKIIYIISVITIMVVAVSCEKKELMTYAGQPDIYFNAAGRRLIYSYETWTDSSQVSFSFVTNQDSVQKIVVAIAGAPAATDRAYKLTVDPASTAILGKHYDALPASFVMPKNKILDTLSIRFHRTADLQAKAVTLILNLEANENFVTEMRDKVIDVATEKRLSFVKHKIIIDDIIKRPKLWLDGFWGTFTRKKLFLMVEVLNISAAYMDASITIAEISAYGKFMQRYLNEQRSAGKTVYEDDGTEMIMGPSSQ